MSRFDFLFLCISLVGAFPSDKGSRIFNGDEAHLGQFPWQARVVSTGGSCGGVILSSDWILATAHCLQGNTNVTVYTGGVMLDDEIASPAKETITHEFYNSDNRQNDIGLIRLEEGLKFDAYTKPIALTKKYLEDETEVVVSGWGATSADSKNTSSYLRYYYAQTISNLECENYYDPSRIYAENVCTVSPTETVYSVCAGDMGDPLVMNLNTAPLLVGFAIFYAKDCQSGNPSGFIRTAPYVGWIKANTGIEDLI